MKNYRVSLVSLCALGVLSCENLLLDTDLPAVPPPTIHASRLATVLDSLRFALDLPALAGAIVADTGIVDAQAVGCRRYGGRANVTNSDRFHLGSNTKAFTGVLLGTMVDEGLVNWDSTLPSFFPEYAASMRPEYRNVTLRNLLSHSSGFMRDPSLTLHTRTPREQRAEVVAWALTQPPAAQRGSYLYSNLGISVAGAIAEKVANRPYEQLLVERVLLPLGITTAGFGPMGTPGLEDQPLQHTASHAPIEPTPDADNPPLYSPSGRLHMSIVDWAKFIRWVILAENGQQTLLRPETAKVLTSGTTPMGGGWFYAFGWMTADQAWAGGKYLEHSGSNTFNYSTACVAPVQRWGVIVATNQGPGVSVDPIDPAVGRLFDFRSSGR